MAFKTWGITHKKKEDGEPGVKVETSISEGEPEEGDMAAIYIYGGGASTGYTDSYDIPDPSTLAREGSTISFIDKDGDKIYISGMGWILEIPKQKTSNLTNF